MFGRLKDLVFRIIQRRKIRRYDRKYRRSLPISARPAPFHIENTFDEFVAEFGGRKISELIEDKSQMPLNADYFFEKYNVIAELKTLQGIYSGDDAPIEFMKAYKDAGYSGSDFLGLLWRGERMPEAVSMLVQKRLRRSIEQRIKRARKQLKKSKAEIGNDDTKCLILIAMDRQPLFGHSTMIGNLAKIAADNYSDENLDGMIYFNPNTPKQIFSDGMEFSWWIPMYRDDTENEENLRFSAFVNLLGREWIKYIKEMQGITNPSLELEDIVEPSLLL